MCIEKKIRKSVATKIFSHLLNIAYVKKSTDGMRTKIFNLIAPAISL